MYFAGPFNLKQGGTGIVGRFPILLTTNSGIFGSYHKIR
jgi:sensor domain CHASE-containing protein